MGKGREEKTSRRKKKDKALRHVSLFLTRKRGREEGKKGGRGDEDLEKGRRGCVALATLIPAAGGREEE